MKVVSLPPIQFTCTGCGAVNEGSEDEFTPLDTMPPTFRAKCAFCQLQNTCSPRQLVAREAARDAAAEQGRSISETTPRRGEDTYRRLRQGSPRCGTM